MTKVKLGKRSKNLNNPYYSFSWNSPDGDKPRVWKKAKKRKKLNRSK